MTQAKKAEKVTLRPLGDNVLVKRLDDEPSIKGGIIIPDTAKKKQETVEVIAIGPGKKDKKGAFISMPVAIGDTVLMEKYSGQEISLDSEEYIIIKAGEIIAIVE